MKVVTSAPGENPGRLDPKERERLLQQFSLFGRWKQLFDDPQKTPAQKFLAIELLEHPSFIPQFAGMIVDYFGNTKLSGREPLRVEHSRVVEALESWVQHPCEEIPGGESLESNLARAAKVPLVDPRVNGSLDYVVTKFSKS